MIRTKFLFLFFCLVSLLSSAIAEDASSKKIEYPDASSNPVFTPAFQAKVSTDQFENPDEAIKLLKRRNAVIKEIFQTRENILQRDPKAQELYKQLVSICKELTVLIENKKAMRELDTQLKNLDSEIQKLPKKKNNPSQKEASVQVESLKK